VRDLVHLLEKVLPPPETAPGSPGNHHAFDSFGRENAMRARLNSPISARQRVERELVMSATTWWSWGAGAEQQGLRRQNNRLRVGAIEFRSHRNTAKLLSRSRLEQSST